MSNEAIISLLFSVCDRGVKCDWKFCDMDTIYLAEGYTTVSRNQEKYKSDTWADLILLITVNGPFQINLK